MSNLRYLALLLAGLLICASAAAQSTSTADADELLRIIAEARESGAQVVIVQTPSGELSATEPPLNLSERALEFRKRFRAILADAGRFPEQAMSTIRGHDADGQLLWPVIALLFAVVFLGVGAVAARYFLRWGRSHFLYLFNPTPQSRAEKVSYLLVRGLMMFAGLAVQILVALALALAFASDQEHVRNTQLLVIGAYATVRGLSIFFFNLLAPDTPSHRMLHLSSEDAVSMYRGLRSLLVISTIVLGMCAWMDMLDLQRSAHKLSLVGGALVSTMLAIGFVVWQRRAVAGMIIGADENAVGVGRKLFGKNLHVLVGLYFAIAWCLAAYRIVLDLPDATGLIGGPILLTFAGIAAYGVAILFIERLMSRRRRRILAPDAAGEGEPSQADDAEAAESAPPATPQPLDEVPDAPTEVPITEQPSAFKLLFERAAGVVVTVAVLWSIFQLWGLELAESGFLNALWEIVLVGFLAYLAYSAVNIVVDQKVAEEGGEGDAAEHGEVGGAGGSRLGTLLPIFRNFLLIVIVVMAGMIVLSELGVNIAPLFAGAGVVGLAVGFGAQTLIADVFSGAFFLMDDAFRRGEYIELGNNVRGTVEKISVRSMQLRHHRGPLVTVPFSQIQHLTNYSRDWAIMKLPLRLTYDTDPEKVRKLIKKLGQELQEHPDFGGDFLQPLKSQGVYQMDDSAMIFRVKFMTKPGHQFTIRKEVYRRIRELFEQEGIKFAHREVTVRLAETPRNEPLSQEQKEAVAGAVRPVLDAQDQAAAEKK